MDRDHKVPRIALIRFSRDVTPSDRKVMSMA
jgi:hypothetical protein